MTLVIIDQLHTVKATRGVAGSRQAFIEIPLTVFSDESLRTGACITTHTIHTLSSVQTARFQGALLGSTVIHVHFTLKPYRAENRLLLLGASSKVTNIHFSRLTMCSRRAGAGEAVNEVDTGSSMEAGLRVAFINIIFTVHPLVAWFTLNH